MGLKQFDGQIHSMRFLLHQSLDRASKQIGWIAVFAVASSVSARDGSVHPHTDQLLRAFD